MNATGRIVLAGGSGFLGRALSTMFATRNCEVVVLGRAASHRSGPVQHRQWDGKTIGDWRATLEGATALVNLTGKSVNCRYTPANRREIIDSRVDRSASSARRSHNACDRRRHLSRRPRSRSTATPVIAGAPKTRRPAKDFLSVFASAGGRLCGDCRTRDAESAAANWFRARPGRRRARDAGEAHPLVSWRHGGQWPAVHQLDPPCGSEPHVRRGD